VDEFHCRSAGDSADAVLLIVAALAQEELTRLALGCSLARLDVLCEVHDQEELQGALDAGCDLIGVNTRDLRTFKGGCGDGVPTSGTTSEECGERGGERDSVGRRYCAVRAAEYQAF